MLSQYIGSWVYHNHIKGKIIEGFVMNMSNETLSSNAMGEWKIRLALPQIEFQIKLNEISVYDILEYTFADNAKIREELKSLLKLYNISEEYLEKIEASLKEDIRGELKKRGLPTEDYLVNPLYNLLVHMSYRILLGGE